MTTIDCWEEIRKLSCHTLRTLDQRKPFDIVSVTEHAVTVLPQKTRVERLIQRTGIENTYRRLVATGKLTRSEIENEFAPYNPAYVAAILAELPGVHYSLRPIRLWMTKSDQ